jgi:hypothetical protein
VGNQEHRLAAFAPDRQQLGLHDLARLRVKRGKRVIEEEYTRVDR